MNRKIQKSFTDGPIASRLILFALPLMAVNLLQVFYNAADMMIVGMSSESDAVGAVGTTLAMINLIVNSFIGISIGANVTLARSIGAGDHEKARRVVHTSIIFAFILGVIAMLIGFAVCKPALAAMGNRDRLLELSVRYSMICFIGVPFLSLTNFSAAMLRASGDSQSPLFILGISGLFNVLCNMFFVLVCGMSVEGVAIATALANVLSAILLLIRLSRLNTSYRLRLRELKLERESLLSIMHIGIPTGIQSAVFSISHLVIQSSILTVNNLLVPIGADYQPVVKGCSAATNLEAFANTAVGAVGQSVITFIGQNAGAKRYDRIKKVRICAYLTAFIAATVTGGLLVILRTPLLGLYGIAPGAVGSLERLAYDSAVTRTLIMMIPYFLLAYMEIGSATMEGLSKSVTATLISISGSVVFRIIWILTAFRTYPTLVTIFISFPISWFITGTLHVIFAKRTLGELAKNSATAFTLV